MDIRTCNKCPLRSFFGLHQLLSETPNVAICILLSCAAEYTVQSVHQSFITKNSCLLWPAKSWMRLMSVGQSSKVAGNKTRAIS